MASVDDSAFVCFTPIDDRRRLEVNGVRTFVAVDRSLPVRHARVAGEATRRGMAPSVARDHAEDLARGKGNDVIPKNTICIWYDGQAEEAARFYAATFPDSRVGHIWVAPGDNPGGGKKGDILVVEFSVCGVPCIGLNGGPAFPQTEAFSFQIATDDQEETDRYWNAIVGNGGAESACGWCKDKWGVNWQITPRVLTEAMTAGGEVAARAYSAMQSMGKIEIAAIEAALRG